MDDAIRAKIFEDFKHMITTESVVGQPIYLGDATIVPFVDISFGFGSGHCSNGTREGGAGGGKMTPTAVLIMKGERIELFSIKNATANNTIDKVINMVPEVIAHFRRHHEKDEEKTAGNDTAATVQASEETVQETVREESGTEEKD